jgi:hypothetical protein
MRVRQRAAADPGRWAPRGRAIMDMNSVLDLKPFLPAEDYALAKQFYLDLGFTMVWGDEQLAAFQAGEFRFLLQNYYVKEWAGNFMMHLLVAARLEPTPRR